MFRKHKKNDVRDKVDLLLDQALHQNASDIHIEPTAQGYDIRLRIDGLLQTINQIDTCMGRAIVSRLMVMAQLLTYRQNIPQEGRFPAISTSLDRTIELRLAIMPTTHGLRAAVRMPAELLQPHQLNQLKLPEQTFEGLQSFIQTDSGLLLLTGPSGSGKSTIIYAVLQEMVMRNLGLSIISIEDPVERDLPGVTQIEITPFGKLTYEKATRSIVRQDPQVLALGEIRDKQTAAIAVQTAMSGHRLISTLHAGSPGGAIVRLLDMGIEPYQLISALFGIVATRLLRKIDNAGNYNGRLPVTEFAGMDNDLRNCISNNPSAQEIDEILGKREGYLCLAETAAKLIQQNQTDLNEAQRVFGIEIKPFLTNAAIS